MHDAVRFESAASLTRSADYTPESLPESESLLDAAVEAEFRTGVREASVDAAKAHLVVRIARIVAGSFLVVVGVAMLVLPGPGVVVILAGLSLLAVDIAFARRLRDVLVERTGRATGFIPRPWRRGLLCAGVVAGLLTPVLALMAR